MEETLEEIGVVKARTVNEHHNLKMSFEKQFSSLERELNANKKNWR